MLQLPGIKQMFSNSRAVEVGVGNVRVGQATVVVALDGTGDTDSIQDGINLLLSTGGVVYIKEGTYTTTSTITISSNNISIIGAGKSSKIVTNHDGTAINIIGTRNGVRIKGLYLYGYGSGANNRGIFIAISSDFIISNCWIENMGDTGIYIVGSSHDGIISDNFISENFGNGILTANTNRIKIKDNFVYDNKLHGMSIREDTFRCQIQDNIVYDNDNLNSASYDGIHLEAIGFSPSYYNIVSGNICRNNDRYEINIADSDVNKTLVSGNICVGTDHVGAINDSGTNTHPNGASGTTNLQLDDLNIIA